MKVGKSGVKKAEGKGKTLARIVNVDVDTPQTRQQSNHANTVPSHHSHGDEFEESDLVKVSRAISKLMADKNCMYDDDDDSHSSKDGDSYDDDDGTYYDDDESYTCGDYSCDRDENNGSTNSSPKRRRSKRDKHTASHMSASIDHTTLSNTYIADSSSSSSIGHVSIVVDVSTTADGVEGEEIEASPFDRTTSECRRPVGSPEMITIQRDDSSVGLLGDVPKPKKVPFKYFNLKSKSTPDAPKRKPRRQQVIVSVLSCDADPSTNATSFSNSVGIIAESSPLVDTESASMAFATDRACEFKRKPDPIGGVSNASAPKTGLTSSSLISKIFKGKKKSQDEKNPKSSPRPKKSNLSLRSKKPSFATRPSIKPQVMKDIPSIVETLTPTITNVGKSETFGDAIVSTASALLDQAADYVFPPEDDKKETTGMKKQSKAKKTLTKREMLVKPKKSEPNDRIDRIRHVFGDCADLFNDIWSFICHNFAADAKDEAVLAV